MPWRLLETHNLLIMYLWSTRHSWWNLQRKRTFLTSNLHFLPTSTCRPTVRLCLGFLYSVVKIENLALVFYLSVFIDSHNGSGWLWIWKNVHSWLVHEVVEYEFLSCTSLATDKSLHVTVGGDLSPRRQFCVPDDTSRQRSSGRPLRSKVSTRVMVKGLSNVDNDASPV